MTNGTPSAEGSSRLKKLQQEAAGCTKCALSENRKQVVFGTGPDSAQAMFVGEAPGKNEDQEGEPFVGRAGKFMNRCLQDLDIDRSQIYITNIVKCRPPENRDPASEEMDACEPYLRKQVRLVDPDVIVSMGSVASKRLTRSSKRISQMRGQWFRYEDQTPVMPTFHPAYLLRNRSAIKEFRRDVKKIFQHIDRRSLIGGL